MLPWNLDSKRDVMEEVIRKQKANKLGLFCSEKRTRNNLELPFKYFIFPVN